MRSPLQFQFCTSLLRRVIAKEPRLCTFLHQVPYFQVVSRPQYLTKISETNTKTSAISLDIHRNNNHLIQSYRERVLTILVEPCPKTRKQIPAFVLKLRTRFSNSFLFRIIQNLYLNWREFSVEPENPIITQFQMTQQNFDKKYHMSAIRIFIQKSWISSIITYTMKKEA